MPLTITIPDEAIEKTGMSERDVLIEVACRLFDAEKLSQPAAAKLAGLTRGEFEDELIKRNLPIIRINDEYWELEKQALRRWEEQERKNR